MSAPVQDPAVQVITAAMQLANAGRPADAIRMLEGSPRVALRHPVGQNVLGALRMQAGQLQPALAAFDAALKLAPGFPDAHSNRGVLLQRLGRLPEALAAYEAALRAAPGHVTALFNRGNVLKLLGRREDAVTAFTAALRAEPRLIEAYVNRGRVHLERDAPADAAQDFRTALKHQPGLVEARAGLAAALIRQRRFDEARALVGPLVSENPQHLEAGLMNVTLLGEAEQHEEALAAVESLIAVAGRTAETLSAKSLVLWKLSRFDEAVAVREEVLALDPQDDLARESLSYLYLTRGDFERGFELYESRLRRLDQRHRVVERESARWNGEPLNGKSLLVLAEQGLGDTLQFIRFLHLLHAQGARITVVVQPPVLGIVRSLAVPATWVDSLPGGVFDFHIPLLSLPRVLGTRVESIPATVPYLTPDPEKVTAWGDEIGHHGLRVGIAWQGNPGNTTDLRRSPALRWFAPLAAIPGVRLISLQGQNGLDQIATLPEGMALEQLGPRITDNPDGIAEIAAVIPNLDVLVTSDTMTAHLAGALGAPIHVALAHDADWRWLQQRDDSPWYPSMRLHRQPVPGDWEAVFADIASAIAARVAKRGEG